MASLIKFLREHVWGLLLIVALLIASSVVVKSWKARHPGAMSVLESQAMDMSAMKPPVGAVPVATEIVRLGRFTARVTYTGSVVPLQEQVVYPRVEGYLNKLSVYSGDRVSGGELIAVVDAPDLQSRVAEASAGHAAASSGVRTAQANAARMAAEREAARSEIQSARSELARSNAMVASASKGIAQRQAEVKSAKANLEYWRAEIAREATLLNAGAISKQEYESEKAQAAVAEAEYANKQAMLEEAKADLDAAKAEVAGKQSAVSAAEKMAFAASASVTGAGHEVRREAAMARQAGAMVATASAIDRYRYIRAPFAGMVTKRYVSPGQFVTPSTPVAGIVQIDSVRLQANVSDRDLGGIRIGAVVVARFAKDPGLVVTARVTSVSPLIDQASRTAVVEALVPNPGHRLLPGDGVTLDIAVSGKADAISVPQSAVIRRGGTSAVWIVRSEAAKGTMEYYCTMHPEVVRDTPGTCPKCLMKLVPRTSGGNKKAHLVTVTVGAGSGNRVGIVSGLNDGDEVIYRGNTYLREGDTVFPTEWTADGPKQMPPVEQRPGGMENMPGMDHSKAEKESPAAPTATEKAVKTYACPMHPEVTSHNPDDLCRICGMKINKPVEGK